MRRTWIISAASLAGIGGVCLLVYLAIRPGLEQRPLPPRPDSAGVAYPDTGHFISLVLNPKTDPIAMYWRDDAGQAIGSLARLRDHVERRGKHLRFGMNGGMYRKDGSPVGLFMQEGRVISGLDTSSGAGNFYLKPNGVFIVRRDSTVAVVTTDRFARADDIAFATQSGPMLVIGGAIHPAFRKDSEYLNIRNGVGVRPDGSVVFAISRAMVTLHEFASYFREMGCRDALYLDGFVSRCYLPERSWVQLDGDFGVMIGVAE